MWCLVFSKKLAGKPEYKTIDQKPKEKNKTGKINRPIGGSIIEVIRHGF